MYRTLRLVANPQLNAECVSGDSAEFGTWVVARDLAVERATGVEPASKAWEAFILPMNYARKSARLWQAQNHSVPRIRRK